MSYPLALNFSSALPGVQGDASSYLWALGWAKRALELDANPFRTDFVFYPLGGATQLLWAVSLIGFISIPLQYVFGLIAAHNLLYLAATVLTAYGTYLLARYVLEKSTVQSPKSKAVEKNYDPSASLRTRLPITNYDLPAFAAGIVFAFAPLRLGYGLAFLNLFNTQFIPFYIFFLLRATHDNSRRAAIFAGITFGLNAYVDFQIAAFLALFSVLYAAYALVAYKKPRAQFAARWATIGALAALVVAPMLAMLANDFALEGGNYIRVYKLEYSAARSYDAASFFAPHARSTLYADAPLKITGVNASIKAEDETALSPDRQAFLGYSALALAAYALVRNFRAARFWLVVAGAFALLSLGPTLHVWGQETRVPLPFALAHQIPILNFIRVPMRYGMMIYLPLAMMVALAASPKSKVSPFHCFRFTVHWSFVRIRDLALSHSADFNSKNL